MSIGFVGPTYRLVVSMNFAGSRLVETPISNKFSKYKEFGSNVFALADGCNRGVHWTRSQTSFHFTREERENPEYYKVADGCHTIGIRGIVLIMGNMLHSLDFSLGWLAVILPDKVVLFTRRRASISPVWALWLHKAVTQAAELALRTFATTGRCCRCSVAAGRARFRCLATMVFFLLWARLTWLTSSESGLLMFFKWLLAAPVAVALHMLMHFASFNPEISKSLSLRATSLPPSTVHSPICDNFILKHFR